MIPDEAVEVAPSLTLDMTEPELVMWDGRGTAHFLARGADPSVMPPRTRAIAKALLKLALEELEVVK